SIPRARDGALIVHERRGVDQSAIFAESTQARVARRRHVRRAHELPAVVAILERAVGAELPCDALFSAARVDDARQEADGRRLRIALRDFDRELLARDDRSIGEALRLRILLLEERRRETRAQIVARGTARLVAELAREKLEDRIHARRAEAFARGLD